MKRKIRKEMEKREKGERKRRVSKKITSGEGE